LTVLLLASGWSGRTIAPSLNCERNTCRSPEDLRSAKATPTSASPPMTAAGMSNEPITETVKVIRGARARVWSITLGQDGGGDALHHRYGDVTDAGSMDVVDFGAGALEVLKHRDDVACQGLPDGSEHEAGRQSVKQRLADLLFELDDLAVDRRGRDVELPRRFADRLGAADRISAKTILRPPSLLFANLHQLLGKSR
jgi:hypothetical protein